jgi:hypothetical protein
MAVNPIQGLLQSSGVQSFFVWSVLSQLVSAGLIPVLTAEQQVAWKAAVKAGLETEIDPAALVNAVIRGYLSMSEAADAAAAWGIGADHFKTLVDSAGNPPGVGDLLTLLRRGVIPEKGTGPESVSYEQGVREGQTKDKWIEPLKALMIQQPSPEQILTAYLEGQVDEATARADFQKLGGDPDYFDLLFNAQGSAPTPLEAAAMARRGIIPWEGKGPGVVSYEQAFLEGPWRNKWLNPYRAIAVYLPPPRTVTALLRAGTITEDRARALFEAQGLSPEDADAYIKDASQARTTASRELARSTIISLYEEGRFSRDQAKAELVKRGDPADVAEYELTEAEWRRVKTLDDHAVTRLHSLYVGHKLDAPSTAQELAALGIASDQVDRIMQVWEIEAAASVRTLTPAQILDLLLLGVSTADVMNYLQFEGYTAQDAEFLVRIKLKLPLDQALPA